MLCVKKECKCTILLIRLYDYYLLRSFSFHTHRKSGKMIEELFYPFLVMPIKTLFHLIHLLV